MVTPPAALLARSKAGFHRFQFSFVLALVENSESPLIEVRFVHTAPLLPRMNFTRPKAPVAHIKGVNATVISKLPWDSKAERRSADPK